MQAQMVDNSMIVRRDMSNEELRKSLHNLQLDQLKQLNVWREKEVHHGEQPKVPEVS